VVLLFGPKGVRRASSTASPSFDVVESKAANAATLTDYDRTSGAALFAYGRKVLVVTSDGGASWKRVRAPVKNARYRRVDFLTGSAGFALLESGRLFKTGNGGKTWSEVVSTGTLRAYDMSFGDAAQGFLSVDRVGLSGRSGWVLHTSDGGATWRPQLIAPTPFASHGLVAVDASNAFGLAPGAQLFYTSTGGDAGATASKLSLTPRRTSVTHARTVKIDLKLTPAAAGALVTVRARNVRTHNWTTAASRVMPLTGRLTISYRVTHTTQLVAQWAGSGDVNGAGSPAATIVKR
jgi:hypothetical protein